VSILAGHGATVFAAAFSPDGKSVVTAGADRTARLWDPGSEPELQPVGTRRVTDFALTADGRRFVTSGDGVTLWKTSPLKPIRRLSDADTSLAAISPDGTRAAASFARGNVVAIFNRGGTILKRLHLPGPATAVTFDRADRIIAAAGLAVVLGDRTVHERSAVDDLATSPDGKLIAVAGEDGNVRIRDARTWTLRQTLRGHKAAVNSVAFSTDGERLVTSSKDEDVRIWNVSTGRSTRVLHWHTGPVADAAISPDGRWLLTAGPITAGIGLTARQELFRPGAYLRGPTHPLTAVAFGGADGRLVIAASKDGQLRAFRCDFCGTARDLIALAQRRLSGR
jgi:WD40 repeat protein